VGGREGEPDRPAAPEEVDGVLGRLVVTQQAQRRLGGRQRRASQGQVESGHDAVLQIDGGGESHRAAA
jgi:hypothetical protein